MIWPFKQISEANKRIQQAEEKAAEARTLRYRKCSVCGASVPTIETALAIRAIPTAPPRNPQPTA